MSLIKDLTITETKNHMGETEYNSLSAWKRAARKVNPDVWFEEDDDTAEAMIGPKPYKRGETKGIGHWDGLVGSIFKKTETIKEAKLKEIDTGWYVYKDRKCIAGPLSETEANAKVKTMGGEAKGVDTQFISPGDARNARRTSGLAEAKSPKQEGWYVYDENDKFIAGPLSEAKAKAKAKELGGDAQGYTTGYTSDYAARRANEGKAYKMLPSGILIESPELQALGKGLKTPVPTVATAPTEDAADETEEKTAVNTPPAEKAEADAEEAPEYKIGDIVKPTKGPHKDEPHLIVKVHPDGRLDIKPKDLEGDAIKYPHGVGATAKPEDVILAESYADHFKGFKLFMKGASLISQVQVDLNEVEKLGEAKSFTDFTEWKKAVLAKYPAVASKLKFKGRVEGGKDTISAEVPGEDRSYGVWDQDTDKGIVLKESTYKYNKEKSLIQNLEAFKGGKIKMGRNTINGYPVDLQQGDDEDIDMIGVDKDAASNLIKTLRAAAFKVKRMSDTTFYVDVPSPKSAE
jgi:hypothetical protein